MIKDVKLGHFHILDLCQVYVKKIFYYNRSHELVTQSNPIHDNIYIYLFDLIRPKKFDNTNYFVFFIDNISKIAWSYKVKNKL